MPTWLGGGANVMIGKFEPEETLEIIERERIGYSFVVAANPQRLVPTPHRGGPRLVRPQVPVHRRCTDIGRDSAQGT